MITHLTGELRQWHKVALTLAGPYAEETGTPNPFLDDWMTVTFTHASVAPRYQVPGYFAADGDAPAGLGDPPAEPAAEPDQDWLIIVRK